MTLDNKDGHVIVIADEGKYVGLPDRSVFGEALSLGINTDPSTIVEDDIANWPSTNQEPQDYEEAI